MKPKQLKIYLVRVMSLTKSVKKPMALRIKGVGKPTYEKIKLYIHRIIIRLTDKVWRMRFCIHRIIEELIDKVLQAEFYIHRVIEELIDKALQAEFYICRIMVELTDKILRIDISMIKTEIIRQIISAIIRWIIEGLFYLF